MRSGGALFLNPRHFLDACSPPTLHDATCRGAPYTGSMAVGVRCLQRAGAGDIADHTGQQLAGGTPGAAGTRPLPGSSPRDLLLCLTLQERNLQYPDGGPDASRMTATARRKLSILGTQLEQLFKWLDSSEAAAL